MRPLAPSCSETTITRRPYLLPRSLALVVALVLATAVAACGGDDEGASPSTPTDDATTSPAGDATEADPSTTEADDPSTTADTTTTTTEASVANGPAMPSPGCEGGAAPGEVVKERHDITAAGEERWFLLTAPALEDPLPLVVDFHGLGEGAEVHTMMSEMGQLGLDEGFVTAFPQGTGTPVAWRVGDGDPDLQFVATLLDTIGGERCIDTSRIYAMGLSNGAMMTSRLACSMADRFAAFAPVAGLTMYGDCDPARPVPILTFHGTADPILLFNGGVDLSGIDGSSGSTEPPEVDLDGEGYPATAREWAEVLDCDAEASDEEVTDELIERTWDCPEGAALEMVIVVGGGHSWPVSEFSKQVEAIIGPTTDDVHASEAAWEFFSRCQLPA